MLLLALATFVVIGAAGLPLLARYLLPAAALLAILGRGRGGHGLVTVRCARRRRRLPAGGRPRLDHAACATSCSDSRERRALQADLRALVLALDAACTPLSAVTYRQVPSIAYAAGVAANTIRPEPDGATIVLPRSARAAESLQSASRHRTAAAGPAARLRADRGDP